jgi:hypothetical protein
MFSYSVVVTELAHRSSDSATAGEYAQAAARSAAICPNGTLVNYEAP